MSFYAIRPVKAGEELTTQYNNLDDRAADRQKMLLPYGFQCSCPSCENPTVSDVRRIKACKASRVDNNAFAAWYKDASLPDDHFIKPALQMLKMIEEGNKRSGGLSKPKVFYGVVGAC